MGSNGAGKTTAMRIVMGVDDPDSGEVRFRGRPVDREARRTFGYMPEERGLYPTAISDPTSTFATIAGLIPFTAPIVQPVLAASDSVSVVEMATAAAIAVATIAALLPLCGRIYRGGVLATRGRISLRRAWSTSRARSTQRPAA